MVYLISAAIVVGTIFGVSLLAAVARARIAAVSRAPWGPLPSGPEPRFRELFLSGEPFRNATGDPDAVLAVLVDVGRQGEAVTLLAGADGSASLYTSRGGGFLGLGGHPAVRDACAKVLEIAELVRPVLDQPVPDGFPYPSSYAFTFWVVTRAGTRTSGPVILRAGHSLNDLAQASMRAIDAIRSAAPTAAVAR